MAHNNDENEIHDLSAWLTKKANIRSQEHCNKIVATFNQACLFSVEDLIEYLQEVDTVILSEKVFGKLQVRQIVKALIIEAPGLADVEALQKCLTKTSSS
jgi:hypothetical protein